MLESCKQALSKKAELILEAFQAPADESALLELEHLIGEKLPDEFKALYLSHDGFDEERFANLFYGYPFISLKKIISTINDIAGENDAKKLRFSDEGIKSTYTFGRKRIPFGDDNGTSLLCIDLDPDIGGIVGQVIMLDYDMSVALLLNKSIVEMVSQFENDLLNDKYSLQEDALEDGVHWLKPVREIEPGNWFNSPRWEYVNAALKS